MTSVRSLEALDGHPHANVFPKAEPKTIRLELDAGESVPEHAHPDREIVFYLVEGAITLTLDDETTELSTGDVARFDGDRDISPRATEPTTALIVLAERSTD